MIYEIRNYRFRPDLIDAYEARAKTEATRITAGFIVKVSNTGGKL
jgi:hypothetical protein